MNISAPLEHGETTAEPPPQGGTRGRHVEQEHLRLMANCAEICQTSANFMLSDSPLHGRVCLICAEACEACAESCEQAGDMRECVEECQSCAKSCRAMT